MLKHSGSSEGLARLSKYGLGPPSANRRGPQANPAIGQNAFHVAGRFLRIVSVYGAYRYLLLSNVSTIVFIFYSLLGASTLFICIQRPWTGRSLPRYQWLSAIFNGSILALSLVFWGYGLRSVGPIRTIMAEYAGAFVAAVSTSIFGRRGHRAAKVYGMLLLLVAFYLLSRGWAMGSLFSRHVQGNRENLTPEETENVGFMAMVVPIIAGLLSALRRLLARTLGRAQAKKRLHSVTVAAATMFLTPFAISQLLSSPVEESPDYPGYPVQVYLGFIVFGLVLSFYVETFAEDKLRVSPASLKHLLVTVGSITVLELFYKMDFSPVGFLLVSTLLGIGLYFSTSIEKKKSEDLSDVNGKERRRSGVAGLPGALEHVFSDSKSSRIALFLLINSTFMVVEFGYGFLSNSLGLISDACHMLFDCGALAIGLYASYISRLDSPSKYAYGYGRFEVLSGYINAVFLVLVAALIVVESIERILDPPEISTSHLLMVSTGGLLVNMIGLVFFHEAHQHAHGGSCSHSGKEHVHTGPNHNHEHCHTVALPGGYAEQKREEEEIYESHSKCNHSDGHDHQHDHHHAHGDHHDHIDDHHHDHAHDHDTHDDCEHSHGGHKHGEDCEHDHYHHEEGHEHSHGHYEDNDSQNHHHMGHHNEHNDVHDHGHGERYGHVIRTDSDMVDDHAQCEHRDHEDMHMDQVDKAVKRVSSRWDEAQLSGLEEQEKEDLPENSAKESSPGLEHVDTPESKIHSHKGHSGHHDCHEDHSAHCGAHSELQATLTSGNAHMDHNMHGIFLHVLADTLGSVGVVISTLLIKYKGWMLTDPACSIFISLLIISTVIPLLRNSAEVILQRIPRAAERAVDEVLKQVEHLEGVCGQQQAHFWSFTPKMLMGSLHVLAEGAADKQKIRKQVLELFHSAGLTHVTVQVEDYESRGQGHSRPWSSPDVRGGYLDESPYSNM